MKTLQRGSSVLEILAVLAIGAMMMLGLSTLIDTSMEETKDQQTALYQSQVTAAAAKHITDNYASLLAAPGAATPTIKITVATLRDGGYLSANFADTNAYGQTPCVLLRQTFPTPAPSPTSATPKIDALVVTEGGTPIPAKSLGYVAANAGQGGGYIPAGTTSANQTAVGAFGSSLVSNATLALYTASSCSGTAANAGHLASAIFYDGPGRLTTDFVYRDAIPGHPELNTMTTPLHITLAAGAVENQSDALCALAPAPNPTWGGVVVNAAGAILSCQSGVWRRQGTQFWRDPVATLAELNALPVADNKAGDVRIIAGTRAAFTWTGTAWVALGVDQNGLLSVEKLQINSVVTKGAVCATAGLVARDTTGLLLSCQNGTFQPQSTSELAATETDCAVILPSRFIANDPACAKRYTGAIVYRPADDTACATIVRTVSPTKDGLVSAAAFMTMHRSRVGQSDEGQAQLILTVINNDTNTVVGSLEAQSTSLFNDSTTINTPLTKAVARNNNGYSVKIDTCWTLYNGTFSYNVANFRRFDGVIVQQTPIITNWTIDLFY